MDKRDFIQLLKNRGLYDLYAEHLTIKWGLFLDFAGLSDTDPVDLNEGYTASFLSQFGLCEELGIHDPMKIPPEHDLDSGEIGGECHGQ